MIFFVNDNSSNVTIEWFWDVKTARVLFDAQYGCSMPSMVSPSACFWSLLVKVVDTICPFFFRDDVPPIIASWKWKINLQIRKLSQFCLTSYVSTQQASDRWDSGRLVTFDGASKASASVSVCVSETDTMIQGKSKISCDALKETIIFYISMYQEAYKSRNS